MKTRLRTLCLLGIACIMVVPSLFGREWLQKPVDDIKPSQLSSNGDIPAVGECVQVSGTNTNYFTFGACATGDMTKAVYDNNTNNIVDNSENVGNLSSTGLVKRLGANNFTTVTDNSGNWNLAYAYGNHATMGYLTAEVDGSVTNELQNLFGIINTDSTPVIATSTNSTLVLEGRGITNVYADGNYTGTVVIESLETDPLFSTSDVEIGRAHV